MNNAVSSSCNPAAPNARMPLTRRDRFLRSLRCEAVDRPPAWLMRQAGRALPEYRKLKETYTFLQLAQTPDLAAEVTLQPIRRFGFDSAIIFSDILVVPEAMGVGYHFREAGGGVGMEFPIRSMADIEKLSDSQIAEKLTYVTEAIRLTKSELGNDTALLGFAGSPWTLANFMLDGGSAREHKGGRWLFEKDRWAFEMLCEKLMNGVIQFLKAQIHAGVDAVQIFDSLGGILPGKDFQAASGVWLREILAALGGRVPVIVFSKGTRDWPTLCSLGADAIGVDHGVTLTEARQSIPEGKAIQGNLPPDCLVAETPEQVSARVLGLLKEMEGREGYVFNLGHGLPPSAKLENVQAIIDTLREEA
jgi:uroporphyrinogen decarboxylase